MEVEWIFCLKKGTYRYDLQGIAAKNRSNEVSGVLLSNGKVIKMLDEWIFCLKCVKYIHNKYRKYMILWFLDKNSTKASI